MNSIVKLALLVMLVAAAADLAIGAQQIHILEPTKACQNSCDLGDSKCLAVGQSQQLVKPKCGQLTCSTHDDNKFAITTTTCGTVSVDENDKKCKLEEDLTKDYPDCCHKIVCN